jgi:hypothetical protein
MANDDAEVPWYAPGAKGARVGIPRQRTPGEEVWPLCHPDGLVHSCELRDNSRSGAGWEVTMLANGELRFSRHCINERAARYVATTWKQDTLRCGFVE